MGNKIKIVAMFTYKQIITSIWFWVLLLFGMVLGFLATQPQLFVNFFSTEQVESITSQEIAQVEGSITIEDVKLTVAMVVMCVLYILIVLYGTSLSNSVIEEKGARIIETLLCYVKPLELFVGKLIGFICGMITQMLLFWGFRIILLQTMGERLKENGLFQIVSSFLNTRVTVFMIGMMLFGFLFYAVVLMAMASFTDSVQNSTALTMPVVMAMLATFYTSFYCAMHTGVAWANPVSYLPFFSTSMSFVVIDFEKITWGEVIVRLLVQVIEVGIFTIFCSKLYKRGVVSYGAKNLFKRTI